MNKLLLVEEVDLDLVENLITEEKSEKKYIIKGPFIECNLKNRNSRIYPSGVIRPIVENYQKDIANNRAVGELNHPADRLEIDPSQIAIKTTSLKFEGENIVLGEAQVCSTPNGMIVRALMDDGIKLAVSSRGAGTLKGGIVQKDYSYSAQDIVWNPSAPSAFVENILEARTEWVIENGILFEKEVECLQKKLKNFNGKDISKVIVNVFEEALNRSMRK